MLKFKKVRRLRNSTFCLQDGSSWSSLLFIFENISCYPNWSNCEIMHSSHLDSKLTCGKYAKRICAIWSTLALCWTNCARLLTIPKGKRNASTLSKCCPIWGRFNNFTVVTLLLSHKRAATQKTLSTDGIHSKDLRRPRNVSSGIMTNTQTHR